MQKYHEVVGKILGLLEENKFWFETFQHEPVTTSEDASKIRHGYKLNQGIKALIVKAKVSEEGKRFIMVCVPGDKKFSQAKLKLVFNINDTRFASEEEVSDITGGVQRGGVPPYGNLFGLPVYADQTIFDNEKVVYNAGDRSFSIAMYSKDWKNIVSPKIGDIAE